MAYVRTKSNHSTVSGIRSSSLQMASTLAQTAMCDIRWARRAAPGPRAACCSVSGNTCRRRYRVRKGARLERRWRKERRTAVPANLRGARSERRQARARARHDRRQRSEAGCTRTRSGQANTNVGKLLRRMLMETGVLR